jgi:DNA modification methylase
MSHEVRHASCLDSARGLASLPTGIASLLLTDAPYAVSKKGGNITRRGGSVLTQDFFESDRDHDEINETVRAAVRESMRVVDVAGAAYVWCGHAQFGFLETLLRECGCDRTGFLVWTKTNPAPSVRKAGWVSSAELCVWGRRPGNRFNFTQHVEMLNAFRRPCLANGAPEKVGHPTQKPLDLIQRIVAASSQPGDLVLDPFCGSGTTLVAAKNLGRSAIGWEIGPAFVAMAEARLEQGVMFEGTGT